MGACMSAARRDDGGAVRRTRLDSSARRTGKGKGKAKGGPVRFGTGSDAGKGVAARRLEKAEARLREERGKERKGRSLKRGFFDRKASEVAQLMPYVPGEEQIFGIEHDDSESEGEEKDYEVEPPKRSPPPLPDRKRSSRASRSTTQDDEDATSKREKRTPPKAPPRRRTSPRVERVEEEDDDVEIEIRVRRKDVGDRTSKSKSRRKSSKRRESKKRRDSSDEVDEFDVPPPPPPPSDEISPRKLGVPAPTTTQRNIIAEMKGVLPNRVKRNTPLGKSLERVQAVINRKSSENAADELH